MSDQPNLSQIMDMAQQVQKSMQEMQQNLTRREVTGVAGTGDIKMEVVVSGETEILKVIIGDAAYDEGKEVLAELFTAAANNAIHKVKELTKNAMLEIYKKTGMPFEGDK